MLNVRTAGDPDDAEILWTDLSPRAIAETVTDLGTPVSAGVVRDWLEVEGLSLHKIEKSIAGGRSPDRNTQFERIAELKAEYLAAGNPVFSIDTKAKEHLGQLYRAGRVRTQRPFRAFDHDFPSWADGVIIPHGIYDLARNRGHLNLGLSHDTSQFACDSFHWYWNRIGKRCYPAATSLLWLCDELADSHLSVPCPNHLLNNVLQDDAGSNRDLARSVTVWNGSSWNGPLEWALGRMTDEAAAERRPVNSRGRSETQPADAIRNFPKPRSGDTIDCRLMCRRSAATGNGGYGSGDSAALHPRLFTGRRSATAETSQTVIILRRWSGFPNQVAYFTRRPGPIGDCLEWRFLGVPRGAHCLTAASRFLQELGRLWQPSAWHDQCVRPGRAHCLTAAVAISPRTWAGRVAAVKQWHGECSWGRPAWPDGGRSDIMQARFSRGRHALQVRSPELATR